MAPSNVFSYLRPHHRRNASNPASPDPTSSAAPILSPLLPTPDFYSSPRITDNSSLTSGSPVSPYPPVLPPIPRVASQYGGKPPSLKPERRVENLDQLRNGNFGPRKKEEGYAQAHVPSTSYDTPKPDDYGRPPLKTRMTDAPTGLRTKGQGLGNQAGGASSYEESLSTPSVPTLGSASFYSNSSKSQSSLPVSVNDKHALHPKTAAAPTPQPQKTGKGRLNLRNPMSLLMRRRSSQTLDNLADESLVSHKTKPVAPMDNKEFDPSIRGHIVHDFSAPRTRRNFSYNNAYSGTNASLAPPDSENDRPMTGSSGRVSPSKPDRAHTPVFRENFDDDTSYEESQRAIRAEQLANQGFLARNSWLSPEPERLPPAPQRSPPPPPPLSKDTPPVGPPEKQPSPPPSQPLQETYAMSVLSPVQEVNSPTETNFTPQETPRKKMSSKTPPSSRSRATSVTDPSFVPAGLPAHLTSKASRFSFQIPGSDSTQEQVLEERHKQKAAAARAARNSTNTFDDQYDEEGMYDDFDMDDGGFEEEIPMLGDDDGFGDQTMSPGMAAFDFLSSTLPTNNPLSPMSMNGEVAQTPRDAMGRTIGFAYSDNVPKTYIPSGAPTSIVQGLGLTGAGNNMQGESKFTPAATPEDKPPPKDEQFEVPTDDIEDDMYFDDGLIADQGEADGIEFDENVFDDPNHELYERRPKAAELEGMKRLSAPEPAPEDPYDADGDEEDFTKHMTKAEPSLAHQPSKAQKVTSPKFTHLDAYHSALADAANKAEAQGRFARKASVDTAALSSSDANEDDSLSNSRPSLIPDDGRFSQETANFPPDDFPMDSSFMDDYDYSDYDSALEDDPMIAAANAEALANDYEGFYGSEFGFYAAANTQGEAQSSWGGYFGSSSLGRSVSGRNAVREPNLTPITERSEYSTRNSFISINHFRDGQQPIQSPGIAQLARLSPYGWPDEDPDLSMDNLMKLKKSAFGGSTGSLGSIGGSGGHSPRNASPNVPNVMQYYPRNASPMTNPIRQSSEPVSDESPAVDDTGFDEEDEEFINAANAIPEDSDEDSDSPHGSPTLNASDYNSLSSPSVYLPSDPPESAKPLARAIPVPPPLSLHTAFPTQHMDANLSPAPPSSATASVAPHRNSLGLISPVSNASPMTPSHPAWRTHSRKGSAADSVTYVREHDEQGGDRWVLERRRTAESGELELVGREIVEGGRI